MRAHLLLIVLLTALNAGAQDRIYTTTGEVIKAQVRSASMFRVRYAGFGRDSAALLSIPGNQVVRVVYQNGRVWQPRPARPARYRPAAVPVAVGQAALSGEELRGKNILLAAPAQFFAAGYGSYAIGMEYERLLGADNKVGIHVPVMAGLQPDIYESTKATFFYTAPGVRFHSVPTGRVDFCAGPALLLGSVRLDEYDRYMGTQVSGSRFISGLMMESELHVQREGAFMFAVHAGAGYLFQSLSDSRLVLELGIRLGARF